MARNSTVVPSTTFAAIRALINGALATCATLFAGSGRASGPAQGQPNWDTDRHCLEIFDTIWYPAALVSGQGRLVYTSASAITLKPYNGNKIVINGAVESIPSAGVALAATGLSATTLYYIYAYMNGSTMTLEASTTTHTTDTSTGVEIKSGNATRSLVGMVYCKTAATFVYTQAQRLVASWFNRLQIECMSAYTAARALGTTLAEPNTEIRNEFLSWGDAIDSALTLIQLQGATAVTNMTVGIAFDSTTTIEDGWYYGDSFTAAKNFNGGVQASKTLAEGYHYATVLGKYTGTAPSLVGAAAGSNRTVLRTLLAA